MGRKVLIVTAVPAEQKAVLRGLKEAEPFRVIAAGVGAAAAAASTAAELTRTRYDLVVSAGIAGGFPGRAEVGSVVLAERIIAADLGSETADGFLSVDELGFGSSQIEVDRALLSRVASALSASNFSYCQGPLLTVTTATGTQETADALARRIPGAVAEAMEGYGIAIAASQCKLPVMEIRTISNTVGPRNRSAWRINEALQTLEDVSKILAEVLK